MNLNSLMVSKEKITLCSCSFLPPNYILRIKFSYFVISTNGRNHITGATNENNKCDFCFVHSLCSALLRRDKKTLMNLNSLMVSREKQLPYQTNKRKFPSSGELVPNNSGGARRAGLFLPHQPFPLLPKAFPQLLKLEKLQKNQPLRFPVTSLNQKDLFLKIDIKLYVFKVIYCLARKHKYKKKHLL